MMQHLLVQCKMHLHRATQNRANTAAFHIHILKMSLTQLGHDMATRSREESHGAHCSRRSRSLFAPLAGSFMHFTLRFGGKYTAAVNFMPLSLLKLALRTH